MKLSLVCAFVLAALAACGVCRPAECPCGYSNPFTNCSGCNACPDVRTTPDPDAARADAR